MLFKNPQSNLVVQLDENFSIQDVQASFSKRSGKCSKQLDKDTDYVLERKNGKLLLVIYNNEDDITDLSITLMDKENKSAHLSIKGELLIIYSCNMI